MSLDPEALANQMIEAARGVVGDGWPTTKKYFEAESKMFAQRLASIAEMRTEGLISEARAKEHVAFQTEAWETALLAVKGLTQLMVEQALNAAIKVIRKAVNSAVGFALFPE